MCSIIGSFDEDKIKDLALLNSYRGSINHSVTYIKDGVEPTVNRYKGEIDHNNIKIPEGYYCIIHQQAPTTSSTDIHPAEIDNCFLWHNGIIKNNTIKELQALYNEHEQWDTKLLLYNMIFTVDLSYIDGSFACLMYKNNQLYMFRNALAPLFVDNELNISSTKFDGSTLIADGKIFIIDTDNKFLTQSQYKDFETVNNPYYFD